MKFKYTTKEGKFQTNNINEIPWDKLHSLNDKPAFENLSNGFKIWCFEGKYHRETGSATIWSNGANHFWLNDKIYSFEEWCFK